MGDLKEQLYGDRPKLVTDVPYAPVRMGSAPKSRARLLLFTIADPDSPGGVYEGTIPDPVPAMYYAQMLADAPVMGIAMAEAKMLTDILGPENARRLATCEGMDPDDLVKIMSQVAARAMGPYKDLMGKQQTG